MAVDDSSVTIGELRQEVDDAIAGDDASTAKTVLARLWAEHGGATQAGFVLSRSSRLPSAPVRASVAVLRSFTVEPLVPIVRAGAAVGGIDLTVNVGDFNTYAQEILDPASRLYGEWAPDVVVLAAHTRDVLPEVWVGARDAEQIGAARERFLGDMTSLLEVFRKNSDASLIVHGLERPADLALGLADRRSGASQAAIVGEINQRLADLVDGVPGCHLFDYDALVARVGRDVMTDEAKWTAMRLPISSPALLRVADAWLRFIHPLTGRVAKVLAVDLDNTLWGGVVGEDGIDGVVLDAAAGAPFIALQQAMLDVRARGVLLAICSKNNPADAMEVLDRHPGMLLRASEFHAIRANWQDKATNLVEIAEELNLGVDAVAFLDDNPAERALVARQLPAVEVLPVGDDPRQLAPAVRRSPFFERLSLSDDDRQRSERYQRDRERTALRTTAASLEDFLASLGTRVSVGLAASSDLRRVAQLTQKTNQFNLTTQRYSEAQIAGLASAESWRIYALRAADRFGDHGLVGVALVERASERWRVDTFLLSCRVIGRDVESALAHVISVDAVQDGASVLSGAFVPSAKNSPAADFYHRLGFAPADDVDARGNGSSWVWDLGRGAIPPPRWIEIEGDGA